MRVNRLPLLLVGLLSSVLLLMAVLVALLWQGNVAKQWVNHTLTVQVLIEQLIGSMRDAETGQRGYLLTSNTDYLAPYESAEALAPLLLTRLRKLTSDNEGQQKRIGEVQGLMLRKFTELADTIALQKQGNGAGAVSLVKKDEGKNLMDEIRTIVGDMGIVEAKLLAAREAKTDWLATLSLGTCAAIMALIFGLCITIYRHLAAQVDSLEAVVADRTDHLKVVSQELAHRSKNQLALIQSIANQTARHSPTVGDFTEKFAARLQALGQSVAELTRHQWRSASLANLLQSQIDWLPPAITRSRITSGGPNILLKPMAAHYLGLALHELATNSVKYGALSNDAGRVSVVWFLQAPNGNDAGVPVGQNGLLLQLEWNESGGPVVTQQPLRSGFGSTILTRLTPSALEGESELEYRASGLRWTLRAPAPVVEPEGGAKPTIGQSGISGLHSNPAAC